MTEALDQVNKGELAFIWEGAEVDDIVAKSDCHLKSIDLGFGHVSYAFALKHGSRLTSRLYLRF